MHNQRNKIFKEVKASSFLEKKINKNRVRTWLILSLNHFKNAKSYNQERQKPMKKLHYFCAIFSDSKEVYSLFLIGKDWHNISIWSIKLAKSLTLDYSGDCYSTKTCLRNLSCGNVQISIAGRYINQNSNLESN